MSSAEELKYLNITKDYLSEQLESPSDELVKLFLENVYGERKTANNIDRFKPVLSKALNQFVNEKVSDRLNKALNSENNVVIQEISEEVKETDTLDDGIETTDEELEFYSIVKFIAQNVIDPDRIYYRDNRSYFNILIDDSIRKWVVRLYIKKNGDMEVEFRNKEKISISSPLDMQNYSEKLFEVIQEVIGE